MEKTYHQPLGGNKMPRFGGPATMMRLPAVSSAKGLDAAFVGVPFDIGTSHRSGARFGPRAIRAESALLRPYNMATRAAPFDSLRVDDLGVTDVEVAADGRDRVVLDQDVSAEDVSDLRIHGEDVAAAEQNAIRHPNSFPTAESLNLRPGSLNACTHSYQVLRLCVD